MIKRFQTLLSYSTCATTPGSSIGSDGARRQEEAGPDCLLIVYQCLCACVRSDGERRQEEAGPDCLLIVYQYQCVWACVQLTLLGGARRRQGLTVCS